MRDYRYVPHIRPRGEEKIAVHEIPQSDYPNSEFRKKITEEIIYANARSGRHELLYNKTQVQTRTEEADSTAA